MELQTPSGKFNSNVRLPQGETREAIRERNSSTAALATIPSFGLYGVDQWNDVYYYEPDGAGGLTPAEFWNSNWSDVKAAANVDSNGNGIEDHTYVWKNDGVLYFEESDTSSRRIGGGWNIYDKVLSPGSVGGAAEADILAIDHDGVLWVYLGYPDGTVTGRTRIGAGWNEYSAIAGQGDLDGDGKNDIVARGKDGVLWLYKGTGDYAAPFQPRVKIDTGWEKFDVLVSTGDADGDGRADLIARATDGKLYLHSGTGNAAQPFAAPKQVGHGYQIYRLLF